MLCLERVNWALTMGYVCLHSELQISVFYEIFFFLMPSSSSPSDFFLFLAFSLIFLKSAFLLAGRSFPDAILVFCRVLCSFAES